MARTKTTKHQAAPRKAKPVADADSLKKEKTAPPIPLEAYSIPQFCQAYNLSIWTYYRLQQIGDGPQISKVGAKTLIGVADAAKWFEARKAPAKAKHREGEAASTAEA